MSYEQEKKWNACRNEWTKRSASRWTPSCVFKGRVTEHGEPKGIENGEAVKNASLVDFK